MNRYCFLKYSPEGIASAQLSDKDVVLVAFERGRGDLCLLIHRRWHEIVPPDYLDYMNSLLADVCHRASADPNRLFRQLETLTVGPIVTSEVGVVSLERFRFKILSTDFIRLTADMLPFSAT